MKISELADRVGVATTTVRYYERIGLIDSPGRTESGYRDYDEDAAARLLFVSRARTMGLSCEQIAELMPVWDGTNCGAARDRVVELVATKQQEISSRIAELRKFSAELDAVRELLNRAPAPPACRTDLTCCVPATAGTPVPIELTPRSARH